MSMANDRLSEIGGGLPLSSFRVGFRFVFSDVKVMLLRTYWNLNQAVLIDLVEHVNFKYVNRWQACF